MTTTRPPALTDEQAERIRASGGTVYQSAHDPRLSYLLNWVLGIVAAMVIAGGVATFSMLFTMREQLAVIAARPEPATKDQVEYLQRQINDLKQQVERVNSERGR